MTFLTRILPLAVLSLTLLHCSMPGDVAATKNTSQDIDTKAGNLADSSWEILNEGRLDDSSHRVAQHLSDLLAATDDTTRVLDATEFSESSLFQTWIGKDADTVANLRLMEGLSMQAFFASINGTINNDYTVNETIPDSRWKALASIAVAMSSDSNNFLAAAQANNIPADSIYSLIVDGLGYLDQANQGQTIPESAQYVLDNYSAAVFLLQLRQNYAAAIVINNFTGEFDSFLMTEASKYASMIPSAISNLVLGDIESKPLTVQLSDSNVYNDAKIQTDGIDYLTETVDTQAALNKLGIPLQFNDTIMKMFTQLDFVPPTASDTDKGRLATISQLNKAVASIKSAYAGGAGPTANSK